ncbi:hypothetical protein MTO96_017005 [Rhipicephalus appendiculatus]
MASSDLRPAETMQSEPDEQWVCLQHDGDTVKEILLKEQDGDEREGKESTRNAGDVVEGGPRYGIVLLLLVLSLGVERRPRPQSPLGRQASIRPQLHPLR